MMPLTASVPPFDDRFVVKYAKKASRHFRSVRHSRATSGMGQVWKLSTTFCAIARPSCRSAAWYAERTCWAHCHATNTVVRRVSFHRCGQPGALFVGEVLGPGAKDGRHPVERVALPPPVPEGVLLHPAADFIDDLHLELFVDRGLVSGERVESGDFDGVPERLAACGEPVRVRLPPTGCPKSQWTTTD